MHDEAAELLGLEVRRFTRALAQQLGVALALGVHQPLRHNAAVALQQLHTTGPHRLFTTHTGTCFMRHLFPERCRHDTSPPPLALASGAMSKFDEFYQAIESPTPYLRVLELKSTKESNTVIRLLKKLDYIEEGQDDWNRIPIEIYLDTGNEYFGGMTRYTINESSIEKIYFDIIKGALKLPADQTKQVVDDHEIEDLISMLDSLKPVKK